MRADFKNFPPFSGATRISDDSSIAHDFKNGLTRNLGSAFSKGPACWHTRQPMKFRSK